MVKGVIVLRDLDDSAFHSTGINLGYKSCFFSNLKLKNNIFTLVCNSPIGIPFDKICEAFDKFVPEEIDGMELHYGDGQLFISKTEVYSCPDCSLLKQFTGDNTSTCFSIDVNMEMKHD